MVKAEDIIKETKKASASSNLDSSGGSHESRGEPRGTLCPSLVVPTGMDFVFAVPLVISQPRQEIDFNIVDTKGGPLCHVVVSERGERNSPYCGIFLQALSRMPLAVVYTEHMHVGTGPVSFCRPEGNLYGILKHDGMDSYTLKLTSGKNLLEFRGDFCGKVISVNNAFGECICVTERCVVNSAPHYKVRISPSVDAGLVICGLLAIDKLEGKNSKD